DGGSAIVNYIVLLSTGGGPFTQIDATTDTSLVVHNLANGTSYRFEIVAVTAAGQGPPSAPSAAVTTPDVPGAPPTFTASPSGTSATLSWTAPSSDGGKPVTGYTVSCDGGNAIPAQPASAQSVIVTGLTLGTRYTCTVAAVNVVGTGPTASSSFMGAP